MSFLQFRELRNRKLLKRQAIILDSLRERRNNIQYSLEPVELDEDLNEIYNEVEGFLE